MGESQEEVQMASRTATIFAGAFAILFTVIPARTAHAQIEIGTWVQTSGAQVGMTLTVEACCGAGGRRLTYRNPGSTEVAVIVESRMDGTDAPMIIGGKPSGQTMGINRVDTNHATSIVKMQGKVLSLQHCCDRAVRPCASRKLESGRCATRRWTAFHDSFQDPTLRAPQ